MISIQISDHDRNLRAILVVYADHFCFTIPCESGDTPETDNHKSVAGELEQPMFF